MGTGEYGDKGHSHWEVFTYTPCPIDPHSLKIKIKTHKNNHTN